MKLIEGNFYTASSKRVGGSDFFHLEPEVKELFSIINPDGEEFEIHFKVDRNKKGKIFLGLWLEPKKK